MTRQFLGLDVGGSSIKAGLVDIEAGRLVGDLISALTPQPSTPKAMLPVFADLAARLEGPAGPQQPGPLGIAFPSVVKHGTVCTAANVDHGWIGVDGPELAGR